MSKIILPIRFSAETLDSEELDSSDHKVISDVNLKPKQRNASKSKMALPIIDVDKITSPIREIIFNNNLSTNQLAYSAPGFTLASIAPSQLIEVEPINSNARIFTDIFPNVEIYKGPISGLWNSIEEFYEFLLDNNFFIGFLIFLFNELLSNIAYQSSLLIMTIYYLVHELPVNTSKAVAKFKRLFSIFTTKHLRGMWWLNIKTDVMLLIQRLMGVAKLVWNIVSKFYLVSVLVLCVGFLQNASPKVSPSAVASDGYSVARKSILEDVLAANSLSYEEVKSEPFNNGIGGYSNMLTSLDDVDSSSIPTHQISVHKVAEGETLEQIAAMYNISIETVAYNNNLTQDIKPGQDLVIPSVDSYIYTAKKDDSFDSIAFIYKVNSFTLSTLNSDIVTGGAIKEGQKLMIPGVSFDDIDKFNAEQTRIAEEKNKASYAQKKAETDKKARESVVAQAKARAASSSSDMSVKNQSCGLIWPTSTRNISQYASSYHMALDIADRHLPDLYAAKDGVVVFSGWDNSGYGNMVLVDHGDGFKTRYAHATVNYVKVGQFVKQGEAVSKMGSTGRSTGPHVHYEVIKNGKLIDPLTCY
ncbi:MAG: hypothetical protein OHK0017_02600 [Patescibacteria group bacterium]